MGFSEPASSGCCRPKFDEIYKKKKKRAVGSTNE